jgi:hypothetical protein
MKTCGGVEVELHFSLSLSLSALDGGEWLASPPAALSPEKGSYYPLDRSVGGPRNLCRGLEKRKILHCRESNPGHPGI